MIKKTLLLSLCLVFIASLSCFAYNWNSQTVSAVNDSDCYTFVASGSDGNPQILFQGFESNLSSASLIDNSWNISKANEKSFSWDTASKTLNARYLANPDKSCVYVYDGKLIYAYWNSKGWSTEYVDYSADSGSYPSMIIAENGLPIIIYYDKSSGDMKCAYASEDIISSALISASAVSIKAVSPVSIVFDKSPIIEGESAKLSWSCTDNSASLVSSNFSAFNINGFTTIRPFKTTVYKFKVKLSNGKSASASATLKVIPLIPTVTITASTTKVVETRSVKLTWNTSLSAGRPPVAVSINNSNPQVSLKSSNFGAATLSGSVIVTPAKTTTYSITVATLAGKKATKKITVKVVPMTPKIYMQLSPQTIKLGENQAFVWSCEDTSSMLSNFGSNALMGAKISAPIKSGSYTISAISPLNRKGKKSIRYSVKKTGLLDTFGPAITPPKVNDAGSFIGDGVNIAAYTADPSGINEVEAVIQGSDGSNDAVPLVLVSNSKYIAEDYFASPNLSGAPIVYKVTIRAWDNLGNMGESEVREFTVPASEDGPPPPPGPF